MPRVTDESDGSTLKLGPRSTWLQLSVVVGICIALIGFVWQVAGIYFKANATDATMRELSSQVANLSVAINELKQEFRDFRGLRDEVAEIKKSTVGTPHLERWIQALGDQNEGKIRVPEYKR